MSKLIWRLTSPAGTDASYLFGTMHLRHSGAFRHWSLLQELIDQCQLFAAEINLDQSDAILPLLLGSDNNSLRACLRPKQYDKTRMSLLKSTQVDIQQFDHLPPLFLQEIISETLIGKDHKQPLDIALWMAAQQMGKERVGLESLTEQLEVIQQIPFCEQAKSIVAMARNMAKMRRHLKTMVKLYQTDRLAELHQAAKRQMGQHRALLIYDRNRRMSQRLSDLLDKQSVFAAVGAGHLWGSKGMLKQLKEKGYRIKEVSS